MQSDLVFIVCVMALVAADWLTGTVAGTMRNGFSSTKMREGLVHKMTYVLSIGLCELIDFMSAYADMGFNVSGLAYAACTWIAVTEIGSILENLVIMNPELGRNGFMKLFEKRGE